MLCKPEESYTPQEPIHYRMGFVSMTVPCQLLLVGGDHKTLQFAAYAVMEQTLALEKKYNFYNKESWLNQAVNNRTMSQVLLDEESAQVLMKVHQHSVITEDVFDICVGTLKSPFRQYSSLKLSERAEHYSGALGTKAWSIDGRMLSFLHRDTLLDLGGVIKEYAVDKAMQLLRSMGIKNALINFGGDIISWGEKADGTPFRTAILHPLDTRKIVANVALNNQSLTTSGHTQRSLQIGDESHSHIIGSAKNSLLSMSVVSNSALISGLYSSALLVKPKLYDSSEIRSITRAFGVNNLGAFKPLEEFI